MNPRPLHPAPAVLFWFRQDLRLHDQPALHHAIACAEPAGAALLPVVVHPPPQQTAAPWGFERVGPHRRRFQADTVAELRGQLQARGSGLHEASGDAPALLLALARAVGADTLVCEAIEAPEEQAAVAALRAGGLTVHTVWQSSLLHPDDLPWAPAAVPEVFTAFRQGVERAGVRTRPALAVPQALPPLPALFTAVAFTQLPDPDPTTPAPDPRSAFPYQAPQARGGEAAALAHLRQYLARGLPHRYKATRNELMGLDFSSKWSPWLATGALSPRTALEALQAFEAAQGVSDGSYWLWFELLWRDHFRFMHLRHGRTLYRAHGLSIRSEHREERINELHNAAAFERWCSGRTGEAFVDAGMRELAATGYLSNRMRQVVASHLIHDLGGDWRAGAAWFESQLVDFDVYSNQGNWLYIAGRGTDPRGGRRFDLAHQARTHDPDGAYRRLWA